MKPFSVLFVLLITSQFAFGNDVHYFGQKDSDIVSVVPYGNNPEVGGFVHSDDASIYFEVYGKGEPIVVLHGGGVGCPYEMGRFIDDLSKDHLVIVPATRGHGKSEIGDKEITYEQKARDMLVAIDAVTLDSFSILGFSDGAYTALKIAAILPERVKKVVAIGAGENIPVTRKFPLVSLDDLAKIDKRFIDEKVALCPEPEHLQGFLNRYFTFFNNERIGIELFSSIKCPVLYIAGELDANAPLDTVINAYKMTPNAQLAIIANAPHQVFIVNYDAVWANVKPFLYGENLN